MPQGAALGEGALKGLQIDLPGGLLGHKGGQAVTVGLLVVATKCLMLAHRPLACMAAVSLAEQR